MPFLFYKSLRLDHQQILETHLYKNETYLYETLKIINDWVSGKDRFSLKTSGSTGKPKTIYFSRKQIETSARMTIDAFGLSPDEAMLSCLSPEHVAGFMMLIRSLVNKCDLVLTEPSQDPLKDLDQTVKIGFIALVPYQLQAILKNKNSVEKLNQIHTVIVGGGHMSHSLMEQVQKIKSRIYHTYGMTETLTHVAIKKINGPDKEASFRPLRGIVLETDESGCLIIQTPILQEEKIITRDIVSLHRDQSFEWLGRKDHVINTAGYKIHPEQIEPVIQEVITRVFSWERPFFIFSLIDEIYGEKLCLAVQGKKEDDQTLLFEIKKRLHPYEVPKNIFFIDKFEFTSLGKINKHKTLEKAKIK